MDKVALSLIGLTLGSLMNAITALMLWTWFVIPLGAPEIEIVHAWGLAITLSWVVMRIDSEVSDNTPAENLFLGTVYNLLILGLGWIASIGM